MIFFDQMKNGHVRVLLDGKCIGKIHPVDENNSSWGEWQFNDEAPAANKRIVMRRLCEAYPA